MGRMLTEEEVAMVEKQRELRDRARAAGSTLGMSWDERERFRNEQERTMWDQRYRETHGGLSKAEVQAAGPNGSGRQYAAIKRGFELQAAHERQKELLGKEDVTRIEEARQKRLGMQEQGQRAAAENREAAIRTAELQAASAEKIAGINTASAEKVAGINKASAEKVAGINKETEVERGKTGIEVARIGSQATVDAARVQAEAQEKRQMAENLMRQRQLDEKTANSITEAAMEMVKNSKNKVNGRPTLTYEEAVRRVMEKRRAMGLK